MSDPLDWQAPGKVAPGGLTEARRALHFAAQAAANLGRIYLPAPADYSHISLRWQADHGALAGQSVAARGKSVRAALRFDPPAWLLLDAEDVLLKELPLAGKSLAELEREIRTVLTGFGLDAARYYLKPPFETEAHPLTAGGVFAVDPVASRELAAHYAGADQILTALAPGLGVTGLPRCWPHHFDYALLHTLQGSGEEAKSINLGMSPGDHYYAEPYYYCSPWPYPAAERLRPLTPPAVWHTHEWTGAVLRSSSLPSRAGTVIAAYWREAHALLAGALG